ncbi:hypothetical protein [Flagellimonas nanhaiensis]|uniref:Uncharacterized protein n=1 Tax=Flagellimonas nanhaiensis TaxID=2292706 RepID=A0A371JPS8_9FLAO|nr:hypothetical protein [Allomuricauda nanhaiensis]RDY59520.1 hypothetical protein DX873_09075 [Allomuricauda nanhaiensis]
MKKVLLLLIFLIFSSGVLAQSGQYQLKVEHFEESRGDFNHERILKIPYSQMVLVENSLNSSSGFGLQMNFHGQLVAVDYMETMPDGSIQVILRREDGKNFYGYKPTIKAILVKKLN